MTSESSDPLRTKVQFVRGVGPKRAELLSRLGIQTVLDVLLALPRDVLDLTHVSPISTLQEGELQTVRGRVVDRDGRELTGGRTLSAVLLDCDGQYLRGVWFNQGWVLQRFRDNELVLFSGKPKRKAGRWEISHPRIQWLDEADEGVDGGILPLYRLTEGLKMHEMRRLVRGVVEEYAGFVPDPIPEDFRHKAGLLSVAEALRGVHLPRNRDEYDAGRFRLIYQDLLEFQLGLALRRRAWRRHDNAPPLPTTAKIDARIRRLLPFQLTPGQDRAVREICSDLDSRWAMHRLLQADVGAGKTVVAIYAMLVAVAAGYQAVVMAPTELLAVQHWQTIDQLLAQSRVNRVLLTGQIGSAERRQALAGIRSGEIQLIAGTQALIQKDVEFGKLGLVVIDEQHKFGVMQRARFSAGGTLPHTLVMTATPIPRSLCLTQFGDLELTSMTDLPPGRQQVVTSRVGAESDRSRAWEFIRTKLRAGRQAYIVCPRIGESPGMADAPGIESEATASALPVSSLPLSNLPVSSLPGAEQVFADLSAGELQEFRLGLLHGQMDPEQRARIMEAFRAGELQALVATSVIEVGVDVPNATLMVIQHAESFGLSQLHQLRGRVGRGKFQGYCFLFSGSSEPQVVERLQVLEAQSSGFEIAEADFRLRGPGDILGIRQHGDLPLEVADLIRDQEFLTRAREAAFELVRTGEFDSPPFAALRTRVLERFGKLLDLVGSG